MKLKYNIKTLPLRFTEELKVINEKHRVLYFEDYIEIELLDIGKTSTPVIVDEIQVDEVLSYTKKRVESEITGQDEELNDIYSDVIYQDEFDGNLLLNTIDGVIDAHDPTPYLQPITESERVYNLESAINILIMMQV